MSFKKAQVVMLPTNEKANTPLGFQTHRAGKDLVVAKRFSEQFGQGNSFNPYYPQHLYFLSDEEIKEGDWCIDINGKIFQHENHFPVSIGQRKIIATTDESFYKGRLCLLPKPSQSFIEKFVEEYNKGNVITEVMVEYDYKVKSGTIDEHKKGLAGYEYFELKVSKDNTITIRKVKDSFTKMDFMNALHKAELVHGKDYSKIWKIIEENL